MYAGHAAIAMLVAAKRPRLGLALLVPVAFAPDWIQWALGVDGHYDRMISHSLVAVGIGSAVAALFYWLIRRQAGDAIAVGLTWLSHWPADFITGIKPTWPGGPDVGLHLYEHLGYDAALESLLVLLCWLVYRATVPAESRRQWAMWLMPLGLIAMQVFFRAVQEPQFTLLL